MSFTPDPVFHLSSPRLYISHLLPTKHHHCEFIYTLYNTELFIAGSGKTKVDSPEKAKAHIEGWIASNFEKNGYGCYLISLKNRADMVNGDGQQSCSDEDVRPGDIPIGIATLMRGDYTVPDIGFALLPEYTGKGYATEAGRRVIQFATEDAAEQGGLALDGVFGFTDSTNEHSMKVCERLGLVYQGVYPLETFGGHESSVYCLTDMIKEDGDLKKFGIKAERVDR